MKTYKVEIKISDTKIVDIKAKNKKEAIKKAERMYEKEEITLMGIDIDQPEFTVL